MRCVTAAGGSEARQGLSRKLPNGVIEASEPCRTELSQWRGFQPLLDVMASMRDARGGAGFARFGVAIASARRGVAGFAWIVGARKWYADFAALQQLGRLKQ